MVGFTMCGHDASNDVNGNSEKQGSGTRECDKNWDEKFIILNDQDNALPDIRGFDNVRSHTLIVFCLFDYNNKIIIIIVFGEWVSQNWTCAQIRMVWKIRGGNAKKVT
jgi:hypothetical protein